MIGETLLHYEIREKIGAGGMGEVFRAHDSKLRRDVALKLLPAEVVHDPEKLARFEREARVLAALNHPHVGAIYGLETDGDKTFLVLELVPGEDLGRVLARGPLPLDQVLTLGRQVAEGLEAAHEQGIIHRDLKPQNIMLTPEGAIKILDFGLAKAFDADAKDSSLTMMATVTSGHTMPGVVMGTASYMSPEQARGAALDRRTDIWAFGCVMFEMISGRRVFEGETVSDVLASVLKTEPEWERLPEDLPPALVRLLRRCFTRDPRQRLRDVGEARIRLEAMIAGDWGDEPESTAKSGGPAWGRVVLIAVAAGLLLGTAGLFYGRTLQDPPPERQLRRFVLAATLDGEYRRNDPVLSADGRRVAYEMSGAIWVQELNELEPRRLEGMTKAEAPFWSPDGDDIAFFEDNQLWRMPVAGGQKKLICDTGGETLAGRGAHWKDDGTILFSRGNSGIYSAASVGGDPHLLIAVNDSTEGDLHEPFGLPDGGILFVVHPKGGPPGRLVIEKDGVRQVLLDYPERRIWNPRYDTSGHIIFERDGTSNRGIWVLPFDLASARATGEPVLVIPEGSRASTSRDGMMVYSLNPISGGQEQMVWVDREGGVLEEITEILPNMGSPSLSPDGRQLAMSINVETEVDVWVQDLRRGTRQRLPHPEIWDVGAQWSPAGDLIYFFSTPPLMKIFRRPLDATASLDTIASGGRFSLSPDGRQMVLEDYSTGTPQLSLLDLEQKGVPAPLFTGPDSYGDPAISPDGRWLAYRSDESGRDEIYLRTFPEGTRPQRVSLEGGEFSAWAPDGRTLFFANENAMFEVAVEGGDRLELGRPVKLFDSSAGNFLLSRAFTVGTEGQRFVMVRSANQGSVATSAVEIVVVDNWLRMLGTQ